MEINGKKNPKQKQAEKNYNIWESIAFGLNDLQY